MFAGACLTEFANFAVEGELDIETLSVSTCPRVLYWIDAATKRELLKMPIPALLGGAAHLEFLSDGRLLARAGGAPQAIVLEMEMRPSH